MEIVLENLPDTVADLKKIILFQHQKIKTISHQYENLQHQLLNLLHHRFGKKSEKLSFDSPQLDLFCTQQLPIIEQESAPEKETISYERTKKRNGHRQIPIDLPHVRIEHTLPEDQLACPCGCGNVLHKIGEVITKQLEIIPQKIYVIEHVRFKYAGCLHENKIMTAPMPNQPIEKGLPGPGLLSTILIDKYDDHLPLYRQSERLARQGIDIARSTLSDWVMQCADLLKPLVEEMKPDLFASPKIHTDDTTVPVLDKSKDKTKTGRLWVYLGCAKPCIIYHYTPTREQQWAMEFLNNYSGYLQADAYTGYDKIYREKPIIEVACMAHARRKFVEVTKNSKKPGLPRTALDYIGKLYRIETTIRDLSPMVKKAIRKRQAKPILKMYKKWLVSTYPRMIPKSPLGQAIAYTLNNWVALTRYLANGLLDIDNNKSERLMKPIAIGRKNWSFAGSDRGAEAAATIYSLIETCKLNKINPYDYLRDVLARLPNTLMRDIKTLLPYHWHSQNT